MKLPSRRAALALILMLCAAPVRANICTMIFGSKLCSIVGLDDRRGERHDALQSMEQQRSDMLQRSGSGSAAGSNEGDWDGAVPPQRSSGRGAPAPEPEQAVVPLPPVQNSPAPFIRDEATLVPDHTVPGTVNYIPPSNSEIVTGGPDPNPNSLPVDPNQHPILTYAAPEEPKAPAPRGGSLVTAPPVLHRQVNDNFSPQLAASHAGPRGSIAGGSHISDGESFQGIGTAGHESRGTTVRDLADTRETGGGAAGRSGNGHQEASMLRVPLMGNTDKFARVGNASSELTRSAANKLSMGDTDGALRDATRAIEAGQADAYSVRAAIYNQLKDYAAAERDSLKALEFDAKDSRAFAALAWSQLRQRKYAAALESAKQAVSLNPNSASNHALLAAAKEVNGDRAGGLESLETAARLNPKMYQAKYEAAKAGAKIYDETEDSLLGGMITQSLGNRHSYGVGTSLVGGLGLLLGLFIAAGVFLFRRPGGPVVGTVVLQPAAAPARESGTLGKYKLVRVMGRGGMGEVYEGLDQSLNRTVAIKKLAADYSKQDKTARETMIKEARTVAALHHPAIVDVYDVIEDDSLYIVFEYLNGRTLHQLLAEKGRRTFAEAVDLIKPVCEALDFAHSRGLVHRDIKPANVMMTDLGVKLMDFGIARSLSDASPVQPVLAGAAAAATPAANAFLSARTTTVCGTGPYMGPESNTGVVCKEGDVYAAAVTFYELVTGRLPFDGPMSHVDKMSLSFKRPSAAFSDLPKALDAVLEKALQPDPEKRYRSGGEFLAALRAAVPVV